MKIVIFGASGTVGQRILDEAVNRGNDVTVVTRDKAKFGETDGKFLVIEGQATVAESVAKSVEGADAVISAVGPVGSSPQTVIEAASALLEGTAKVGVERLLFVGGAGSLEVAPGVQLIDTPEFPSAWKEIAQAHSDALDVFKNTKENVDWVNISPAALIQPGERTGKYRLGKDNLVVDENGESKISAEDYAIALIDEVETPKHHKERITVAY